MAAQAGGSSGRLQLRQVVARTVGSSIQMLSPDCRIVGNGMFGQNSVRMTFKQKLTHNNVLNTRLLELQNYKKPDRVQRINIVMKLIDKYVLRNK